MERQRCRTDRPVTGLHWLSFLIGSEGAKQMKTLVSMLCAGVASVLLTTTPAMAVTISYELTIFEGNESEIFEGQVVLQEESNGDVAPSASSAVNGNKPQTTLVGKVDSDFVFKDNRVTGLSFTNILDPVSTVTFGVTDVGASSIFALSVFGLGIVPSLTGMAELTSSIQATCSDADQAGGSGGAGCAYSPAPGESRIAQYDINGLFIPALDLNPGEILDGTSVTGTLFTAMTSIDCGAAPYAPACTTMSHSIAFTGPGGGDSMTFRSRLEIVAAAPSVPEPGTIALAGLGLVGLCGLKWARRRR
jgi:hypothetical protein